MFEEEEGIIHEKSVSYTSEQNGKIERDRRTVAEAGRSMLNAKKLDDHLWAEAVNTTVYVLNRTSKKVSGKTPFQIWTGKDFDINTLRVFGNEVSVHIPKVKRKNWDSKAVTGIFVGYGETTKGYRVYLPDIQSVEIKRDVEFLKSGGNTTAQKIQEAAEIGEEDNSDWDPGEVADYSHNETDVHQDDSNIGEPSDDHRDHNGLDRDENDQTAELRDDDDQYRVDRKREREGLKPVVEDYQNYLSNLMSMKWVL